MNRLGETEAVEVLVRLLTGLVPPHELMWAPYDRVLRDIGDGHAEGLMADESGRSLVYRPRVWAARALAYVGNTDVGPALVAAADDDHWRVRMTAIQTIGRLGIEGTTTHLLEHLNDEHPRVRAAPILALERVGTAEAVGRLVGLSATGAEQSRAEQAAATIIDRGTVAD